MKLERPEDAWLLGGLSSAAGIMSNYDGLFFAAMTGVFAGNAVLYAILVAGEIKKQRGST